MDTNKKIEWLVGLFVIILTGVLSTAYSYGENKNESKAIVVVDAGHGGYDPGKVAINDALEKDINLLIAKYLEEYLTDKNFEVVMTRTSDEALQGNESKYRKTEDLKLRCDMIESANADYCISIHQNSYTDTNISGAQVFYYSGSMDGEAMAISIQESLIENADKSNTRKAKKSSDYYMLKNSSCPTVIVECGFLSNRREADKLCSEDYQKTIAEAIGKGFINYHKKVSHE